MPRSLYAKLALVLVLLVLVTGVLYIGVTLVSTRLYLAEVNQQLNADLAAHLAADLPLFEKGAINRAALEQALHMMMVINPAIEIYLLDPGGRILAYSAPPGKVALERVDLGPVRRFLGRSARFPILGDDPRHPGLQKAFSAAPVESDGRLDGYLYVVLASEQWDSARQALAGSWILRLSVAVVAGAAVLGLLTGLLAFRMLTARLRRLTRQMERFSGEDGRPPGTVSTPVRETRGDEIDRLSETFTRMAGRIRDQVAELKRTDALRRELVANISHDLRTPLAALRGYIETLQIKADRLTEEERREYLAVAERHGERLGRLVEQLFELAKLEAQEEPLQREPFALAELVQDVVQDYRLEAERRGVVLDAEPPADLPFVWGEIGLIERVFQNLIDNALRHTESGGRIQISLAREGDDVAVTVRDDGRGIAEEELPVIFDRAFRGRRAADDREGREAAPGIGLGLAISRRILELHGRSIAATSRPGEGACFEFRLPLVPETPPPPRP